MTTEYYKTYSPSLRRDMEYMVYGHAGRTALVFPSQDGRFSDYENFGMVQALAPHIEAGRLRLVCVDSIDGETWSDANGDEHRRITLHEQWYHYIVDELIPTVNPSGEPLMATGCSMGGLHAANFFFRRPDLFDAVLSLSGLYHAGFFFPNYHDPLVYDNSPLDFLRGMPADHPYLDLYRSRDIILCVGQGAWEDELLDSTRRMDALLREKGIPAWVDYWGYDVSHDWEWWRKQVAYFMNHLLEA